MKLSDYLTVQRLTVSEFARRTKLNVSSVHRAASGKVMPSVDSLRQISLATGGAVTANDFLAESGRKATRRSAKRGTFRVGVDIGGTFTDVLLLDVASGDMHVEKVATTPGALADAVLEGLDRLGLNGPDLALLVHGTTVGLNAFLERRGAPTGLITTAGFRDVYEIGRHNRVETYDLFYRKPVPLVPRRHRLEVRERIDSAGCIQEPLIERDVLDCVAKLRDEGITSIAVCLINAYLNPFHEERVCALIELHYPEASVTQSSQLVRQWREYERTSTSVVNAYIMPVVGRYLDGLEAGLADRGHDRPVFVSQSAGGVISVSSARNRPVLTIMSGPSGGVVAAAHVAKSLGRTNLITFDMGGTSTDIALVHEGRIKIAGTASLDGHPLLVPMIDITSIGAGGGSVAKVLPTGALAVGPESAGAVPGPVCYGKGGRLPTVTDANLVLGRLPALHFLGGAMELDTLGAVAAIQRGVAEPLGLSVTEAAAGVIALTDVKMAYAVRAMTIERGLDPKSFALMPFGGAGPMHACSVARHLGIPEIVVPVSPGAFSAFGMLVSDVRHDFVRTHLARLDDPTLERSAQAVFDELRESARITLANEGVAPSDMVFESAVEVRYVGQEYTVSIPLDSPRFDRSAALGMSHQFHARHERQYGHSSPSEPLEIVDIRLSARGLIGRPEPRHICGGDAAPSAQARLAEVDAQFGQPPESYRTLLYRRDALLAGNLIEGPAILVERTATIVIEPGFRAEVLYTGEILITAGWE